MMPSGSGHLLKEKEGRRRKRRERDYFVTTSELEQLKNFLGTMTSCQYWQSYRPQYRMEM